MIRLSHNQNCLNDNDECSSIRNFKVISHPNFDAVNLTNDIALIKLEEPAKISGHGIVPVCLPFGIEYVPSQMKGINLDAESFESNLVSLPECHARLKNSNKYRSGLNPKMKPIYEDSQFCAKVEGTFSLFYLCSKRTVLFKN